MEYLSVTAYVITVFSSSDFVLTIMVSRLRNLINYFVTCKFRTIQHLNDDSCDYPVCLILVLLCPLKSGN